MRQLFSSNLKMLRDNNRKYKVKKIRDSTVYAKKVKSNKPLLTCFVKGLTSDKKYLRICIGYITSLTADQHFLQRLF